MVSETFFNIYYIGTYIWFLAGVGIIGIFGIKDAYHMLSKKYLSKEGK